MANELVHGSVGTGMTQAEFEAVGLHVLNSQVTGDLIYASSATQLSRLAVGAADTVFTSNGTTPSWSTTPILNTAIAKGTWTASGTWTIPAVTLGGTVTGGNQNLTQIGHIGFGNTAVNTLKMFYGVELFTNAADWIYGIQIEPNVARTGSTTANGIMGIGTFPTVDTTNNQNWTATYGLRGVSVQLIAEAGATGTITGAVGFYHQAPSIAGITLTNLYGFVIENATGAGTVTNQYGVYIAALTKGATLNYALYCVGANVGVFAALPTSDPAVAGKWWANSGIVTVSAG